MTETPTSQSLQLAAQAWCKPETSSVVMDVRLATEFARILDAQALALRGEPVASSACPMDGIDMPHGHTVEAVAAYLRLERDRFLLPEHRDAIAVEVRGCPDGWVLLPLKMTAEMIRAVDETLLRSGEGNEEHVQRHFNSLVRAAPKPLYAAPISGERDE